MLRTLVERYPEKPVIAIRVFPNGLPEGWTIHLEQKDTRRHRRFHG